MLIQPRLSHSYKQSNHWVLNKFKKTNHESILDRAGFEPTALLYDLFVSTVASTCQLRYECKKIREIPKAYKLLDRFWSFIMLGIFFCLVIIIFQIQILPCDCLQTFRQLSLLVMSSTMLVMFPWHWPETQQTGSVWIKIN